MQKPVHTTLSRRERQIMDIVYGLGSATVADVLQRMPDPPSYSAVRAMLRVLEEKGHLRHEADGPRYVFFPVVEKDTARESALRHLVRTFFDGSVEQAVAAMIDTTKDELSGEQLDRLAAAIQNAREEGK